MRAGVIDQYVNTVEFVENSRHCFVDFALVRNITPPAEHFRTRRCRLHFPGGMLDCILMNVHNHRIGTVVSKSGCHGGPQTLRPTGYQGDFSG